MLTRFVKNLRGWLTYIAKEQTELTQMDDRTSYLLKLEFSKRADEVLQHYLTHMTRFQSDILKMVDYNNKIAELIAKSGNADMTALTWLAIEHDATREELIEVTQLITVDLTKMVEMYVSRMIRDE